jgi:hypothetical protein
LECVERFFDAPLCEFFDEDFAVRLVRERRDVDAVAREERDAADDSRSGVLATSCA